MLDAASLYIDGPPLESTSRVRPSSAATLGVLGAARERRDTQNSWNRPAGTDEMS